MASEKDGSALPASGLALVLALLVGAVAVHDISLEQYRPVRTEKNSERLLELQDADARLWQDPFAAVQHHQEELQKALSEKKPRESVLEYHRVRHTFEFLRSDIVEKSGNAAVVVLGVTVPGGPYAEDIERRQRSRYAVLSGLSALNFAPRDGEHVGYVAVACDSEPATCDTRLLPEIMPFEWFEREPPVPPSQTAKPAPRERLLVIWLTEHPIAAAPITSIERLVSRLGIDLASSAVRVRMLAPFTSDTLKKLAAEAVTREETRNPPIEIYSPSATASAEALAASGAPPLPLCRDPARPARGPVCVLRTIANDDRLADLAVAELALRGIKPGRRCTRNRWFSRCERIALIYEWDTLYGRTLPDAVARRVCRGETECPWLLRASYLQGIDGTIASDTAPAPAGTSPRRDAKDQTKESSRSERADGRHQFDYLRRLVDQLKRENTAAGRGEISTIGILGSDVYDKLLVLRALRKEFPHAQFFTTDLDARLLHPEEFKTARNLVVASAFGLELAAPRQNHIPPFRDVYQTSVFFATQLAVSGEGAKLTQREVDERVKPLVFEVGRHSAIQLPDPGTRRTDAAARSVQPAPPPLVPPWIRSGWVYPAAVLLAILLILPLYPAIVRNRRSAPLDPQPALPEERTTYGVARWVDSTAALQRLNNRATWSLARFAALCAGLAVVMHVFAVVLLDDWAGRNHEPLRFYEGISVWPSEAIRLFAGALAVFFVTASIKRMQRSHLELSGWFFNRFEGKRVPQYLMDKPTWRDLLQNFRRPMRYRIFACDLLEYQQPDTKAVPDSNPTADARATTRLRRLESIDTERFWHACAFHSSASVSLARTTVASVLFFVFSLLLVGAFGVPHTPFRGQLSRDVDYVAVLAVSTPALVFLTFYVIDATLMCVRFINALGAASTDWPAYTREHWGLGSMHTPAEDPGAEADIKLANDHLIDIRLSAKRTAAVSGLIYYPMLIMLLLLFARSTLFDNWHWPAGLVIPLALAVLMLIACIIVLRRAAERARATALESISQRLLPAGARQNGAAAVAQLERVLRQIGDVREGAFAQFTQQPIIKALLIFFSASGLAILEYFGVITF